MSVGLAQLGEHNVLNVGVGGFDSPALHQTYFDSPASRSSSPSSASVAVDEPTAAGCESEGLNKD